MKFATLLVNVDFVIFYFTISSIKSDKKKMHDCKFSILGNQIYVEIM